MEKVYFFVGCLSYLVMLAVKATRGAKTIQLLSQKLIRL